MEKLSHRVMDYTLCEGACSSGIATVATLEGGPPSTDLSYVMPGARSAVVFAIPLDQELIPDYLGKVDRPAFEKNNETVNSIADGIAMKLANFMTQKGHPAVPLAANDVYRDDTPKGRMDMLYPVSLRFEKKTNRDHLKKGDSTWQNPQEGITSFPRSSGGIRTGFRRRS